MVKTVKMPLPIEVNIMIDEAGVMTALEINRQDSEQIT